jgi:hypothetical protein
MGLKEQAIRLMRTIWNTPQMLAEELFAILSQDSLISGKDKIDLAPTDGESPIKITVPPTRPGGQPPPAITITNGNDTLTITSGGINFNGSPLQLGGGGGFPSFSFADAGGADETKEPEGTLSPFAVLGRIRSGSGRSYVMEVWRQSPYGNTSFTGSSSGNTLLPANGTVTATIAETRFPSDQSLPSGSWHTIVGYPREEKVAGGLGGTKVVVEFYFMPPVWLDSGE